MTRPTAQELRTLLGLAPLPVEGGLFRETWRSHRHWPGNDRPAGTAIFALITDADDGFSALHRLPTDEVYHFYLGDPLEMLLLLHPDGGSERVVLGHDVLAGQHLQFTVPARTWMGSRVLPGAGVDRYALVGTTMAPGFAPEDYEGGSVEELVARYPAEADLIRRLVRPHQPLRMPDELTGDPE